MFKPRAGQIWHCCQRLATAATFLRKELRCSGTMMRRWALQTRHTLLRNTAIITKDLIKYYALVIILQAKSFLMSQVTRARPQFSSKAGQLSRFYFFIIFFLDCICSTVHA